MSAGSGAASTTNPLEDGAVRQRRSGQLDSDVGVVTVAGADTEPEGDMDIEAAVKDGTLSSDEAIVQMQRQMAQM